MKDRTEQKALKVSLFGRFLNLVERVGNGLPHPITLFAILAGVIILISGICSWLGVSATGEMIDSKTLEMTEQTIHAVSLLSRDGLVYMLTNAVDNFTSFAPLGVVLVTMLGVGCAEGSGYMPALMKKSVSITPKAIVTPMIVFLGVMSNMASDVGYVVLIPIGAIIFMAYGRHPLAGLAAAFAGVSGGYSANLLIGTTDPLLAGISTEAAKIIDPAYEVHATSNWYFMIVSTFLVVLVGTIVTNKIVEPRLPDFRVPDDHKEDMTKISLQEAKALKYANITIIALILLLVFAAIPGNSILRNPDTGSLIANAPLIQGMIVLVALIFFIPSVVFGKIAGVYKNEKDVCNQLGKNMSSMGSYIALTFVAAQFINYFSYTKLGTILALKGAEFLKSTGMNGAILMVLFILFVAFINLFMGSASAKWTILAPVFIPMFMLLGYSPELTQVAYRIGDSTTNIISPLMSYFAMIVVYAKKYDEKSGIGTLISTMLPYSLIFLISWSLLLVLWMVLGLPLGPGAGFFY